MKTVVGYHLEEARKSESSFHAMEAGASSI